MLPEPRNLGGDGDRPSLYKLGDAGIGGEYGLPHPGAYVPGGHRLFAFQFGVLASRGGQAFIPVRDCPHFVLSVRRLEFKGV